MSLPVLTTHHEHDKALRPSAESFGYSDESKPQAKPFYHAGSHLNTIAAAPEPDTLSELSLDDPGYREGLRSRPPPAQPRGVSGWISSFWVRNKGLMLVLLAQVFGTLMNVTTRLLEVEGNNGKGLHPFQILFARMSITVLLASVYMWWKNIPDFPLGAREVRYLLVARGLTGFFGVFGIYYSLLYLPLADATVLTFLAPSLACWACSILINEPFTRMEQIGGIVSVVGVVLIARPTSLFSLVSSSPLAGGIDGVHGPLNQTAVAPNAASYANVTPQQRLLAVGVSMLGVFGAAGAFTTIRWIGKRSHPLITVNYFAAWCTIVSTVMMFALPGVGFLLPATPMEWCYLAFLGACGFIMQFLLASGLQYEKSSRATNMVYTQMLFALTFDKLVFGTTPGLLSIAGSTLILGSAIYVAIHKVTPSPSAAVLPIEPDVDEERGLVDGSESDDENEVEHAPAQDIQLQTFRG